MAVLVEAISVIVRRRAIDEAPGGWEAFQRLVPNRTLCMDGEIARVGFMTPADVEAFVTRLEAHGIRFLAEDKPHSIAVVDQIRGPTLPCEWLEFGHVTMGPTGQRVAACRLVDSKITQIFTPTGWRPESSLSSSYNFVPERHVDKVLKFIRHENGLDVYWNDLVGREVFVGRTSGSSDAKKI